MEAGKENKKEIRVDSKKNATGGDRNDEENKIK